MILICIYLWSDVQVPTNIIELPKYCISFLIQVPYLEPSSLICSISCTIHDSYLHLFMVRCTSAKQCHPGTSHSHTNKLPRYCISFLLQLPYLVSSNLLRPILCTICDIHLFSYTFIYKDNINQTVVLIN